MKPRVTLTSIAAACDVKPATVSRVLNNVSKGFSVSEEKRELIKQTARKMGYVPNLAAQNLRLNRTNRIMIYGLTIGWGIKETTYSYMLTACVKALNAAGFEVDVVYPASSNQILSPAAFDGAIIINNGSDSIMEHMHNLKIPYVVMNDRPNVENCSYVAVDDIKGMGLAISHLREKGHKKIAYRCGQHSITRELAHKSIADRYTAYIDNLSDSGVESFSDYQKSMTDAEFIREMIEQRTTAVVTYDVTNALDILKQCAKDNIKVPEELSIVTFNEPAYPTFPDLTAVTLPLHEMGQAAAEILIGKINGALTPGQRIFEEQLVEGHSVADLN